MKPSAGKCLCRRLRIPVVLLLSRSDHDFPTQDVTDLHDLEDENRKHKALASLKPCRTKFPRITTSPTVLPSHGTSSTEFGRSALTTLISSALRKAWPCRAWSFDRSAIERSFHSGRG